MRWRQAPATIAIAGLTAAASLLVLASGHFPALAAAYGFTSLDWTAGEESWPLLLTRPLTATLIHAGLAHLVLNLVMLVYCGAQAERAVGWGGIGILYLVGAYAAAAGQWALAPHSPVPVIGASGAISAVVAAYALLFGRRQARALGPVPGSVVHIVWLAAAWIGIQLLVGYAGMGVPGSGGATVAIGAHIGGFLAGLALARPLLLWRYRHA